MCGRYYIDDSILDSVERLVQKTYREKQYWTARDVHPTDAAPVISAAADGLAVVMQRWGYPGRQKGTTVFNARAESVTDRRMFENGIRRHRAVIPCVRFYEWNREKEKAEFSRTDSPVLYLAGFYDRFEDGDRYIILTTAANASMAGTHDRMPLILGESEVPEWVTDDAGTEKILRKVPALLQKRMEYEQRSFL